MGLIFEQSSLPFQLSVVLGSLKVGDNEDVKAFCLFSSLIKH